MTRNWILRLLIAFAIVGAIATLFPGDGVAEAGYGRGRGNYNPGGGVDL